MPERDIRTGTPSWVLVWKSATSSILWNNIVFTIKIEDNGTELIEGISRWNHHAFDVLRCNVVVLLIGQREASLSLSWNDTSERRRTRMIAVKLAQSRKFGNKGG